MPLHTALVAILIVSLATAGLETSANHVLAAGTQCAISRVSPTSAPSGTDTGFAFVITSSTDSLAWIKITSPSANLAIDGASSDWLPTVQFDSTQATFSGSAINPGNPISVNVSAQVAYFPASNWTVQASTDSAGSNPAACTGSAPISVTDTTPPVITSISATAFTTSATVTWSTDKITDGEVDYGLTSGYGALQTTSTFDTSHTLTLSSLTPLTTYHYQILATDQSGNSTTSVDGTFMTAAVPTSTTSGGSTAPVNTKVSTPSDKIPPTISLSSKLPRVSTVDPTVSGVADDNIAVVRVEYSVDGGKDWLPTDTTNGLGGKHVVFSFTPLNLDDGTYSFVVRATDGGGNTASTTEVQVVIDRLPPTVGGNVIALGPQILVPDASGTITTLPNVDLSIHLTANGGATAVSVAAVSNAAANGAAASFTLQQSPGSGLWNGTLSFTSPGSFQLVAHAVDGAGNTTSRAVGSVTVVKPGAVLSADGPIRDAVVSAYYRDPDTNTWIVWDGAPYGQTNPQHTDEHGAFQLLLPAGTYYLHASAPGYEDLTSASFTIAAPTPVASVLHLQRSANLGPLHISLFSFSVAPLTTPDMAQSTPVKTSSSLIGTSFPTLALTDTSGSVQNSTKWLGKPTVVTVLSTWVPTAAEQIGTLERLAANHDLNVKVIGLQENTARLNAYNTIGGTTLEWLADPTSQTAPTLQVGSLPMHFFVDRKGVVRRIAYGVLSYQQLQDYLSGVL